MKSFYEVFYWCRQCRSWKEKNQAVPDKNGNPCCPKCGKRLRTKPLCSWRNKKAKTNPKTSTSDNNATSFQTLHHASGFPPRPASPTVAENIIEPAKQPFSEKPCNHNMENHQNMGGMEK